jgi:peptidoglycan/xylan/chitin deacetylase (PgdA/CDA1 family)
MLSAPLPILLYHQVKEPAEGLYTPPALFEQHLAWLAEHGYRSVRLEELEAAIATRGGRPEGKRVLITFDDGYADLASTVAPALKRHGFTGVAFLITNTMGRTHIDWNQARTLAAEGTLEFQSHSHTHKPWDAAAAHVVRDDLATSVDLLMAELGLPRSAFRHVAWPWGRSNPGWEAAARDLGLVYQHIVQRGAVTKVGQTERLPRICVDGSSLERFRQWVTLLSSPLGARACNRVFATIRRSRHGAGYA